MRFDWKEYHRKYAEDTQPQHRMKVITEPEVRVISAPVFYPHPKYELPFHKNDAENIIATGGKVCYDSYGPEGNPVDKHVQNLVASGHHSVIEHVHVGLFLAGISRGCSHEIVRHRMFNYSQRSTRYTAEEDAAIVLDPYYADIYRRLYEGTESHSAEQGRLETTATEKLLLDSFITGCTDALAAYRDSVKSLNSFSEDSRMQQGIPTNPRDYRKWCRGKARQLLPHALETRMLMTGNLRAWRHFLIMRTSRHAEAEIRRLAHAIFPRLDGVAPNVFADLKIAKVDGYIELT